MVTNDVIISTIAFFGVWILILIPMYFIGNKLFKKAPKDDKAKAPSDIKPATNKHKALLMRCYTPEGMDPRSSRAAEAKLQICQNLFVSSGKITGIKEDDNKSSDAVTVKAGDISIKIPQKLKNPFETGDSVFVYYEKGLSGIPHYVTTIKSKELAKITRAPRGVKPQQ